MPAWPWTRCAPTIPHWRSSSPPCSKPSKTCGKPCWQVMPPLWPNTRTSWRSFNRRCSTTCGKHSGSLQNQDVSAPLRVDDLPAALRDQFAGATGKFLLQVFPKNDVWQRANQEAFVTDLRTVDPERHRHARAILRIRNADAGQLHSGGVVFAYRDCHHGAHPLPQSDSGDFGVAAGRHWNALAGRIDGLCSASRSIWQTS